MAVQRWTFYDGTTTVTLPINPSGGGSPERSKNLHEIGTTAPDGVPILFEGSRPSPKMEFEGTLLTEAHYNLLEDWWDKYTSVKITDDLNRQLWVYFESFIPRRVRSALHPWKHTFSMRAVVLIG